MPAAAVDTGLPRIAPSRPQARPHAVEWGLTLVTGVDSMTTPGPDPDGSFRPGLPSSMRGSTAAFPAGIYLKWSGRGRRGAWPFSCRRWPARRRAAKRWRSSIRSTCSIRCRRRRAASTSSGCCGFAARRRARRASACRANTARCRRASTARSRRSTSCLQAGGFGLVVLDLGEVAAQTIKRLPYTTWLRLHRVIEGSETACVLIGSEPIARSAGGVTVQLASGQTRARHSRAKRWRATSHVRVPLSAAAC